MKVLFAVSNDSISNSIVLKYQQKYKEIITSKNVYYFNAIIKELQKDKTYDVVVIGEDLEPISNNNYDTIDKFIFEKLDNISDEASKPSGEDIPIILICSDRRTKSDGLLIKLFGIGIYNALLGNDRNIDMVCDLINKPRNKKEAKEYYRIESEDVNYKPEKETEVSENEIQNILSHYKKIGNNEKKCVQSFDSIASQYNDTQLRIIVKFLPINVKSILEKSSQRYQTLMSGGTVLSNGQYKKYENNNQNMDILTKDLEKPKLNKPVVIPSTMEAPRKEILQVQSNIQRNEQNGGNVQMPSQNGGMQISKQGNNNIQNVNIQPQNNNIQNNNLGNVTRPIQNNQVQNMQAINQMQNVPKQTVNSNQFSNSQIGIQNMEPISNNTQEKIKPLEEVKNMAQNNEINNTKIAEEPQKRRGRPKKVVAEETNNVEVTQKKGRGRPKKVAAVEEAPKQEAIDLFGLANNNTMKDVNLFAMSEEPGEELNQIQSNPYSMGSTTSPYINNTNPYDMFSNTNPVKPSVPISPVESNSFGAMKKEELLKTNAQTNNIVSENFIAKNSKLLSFVGTSKNGTSFIVYNLAELLSQKGIKTAILDLTKNKNSYYMFTDNNQNLMQTATNSIRNLSRGIVKGIQVNNNLTVFTSLPGEEVEVDNFGTILKTLDESYSAVLMDCDFETNINYFAKSTEMYLVQSMDALTIQPLTLFLSELKLKGALDESKLRVIINKEMKLKILNARMILGGMAKYNEPSMTLQRDLFNPNTIKHIIIPFEEQTYARYIEAIAACKISLNGYSERFLASLNELANMVYPLLPGGKNGQYAPPTYNQPKKGLFGGRDKDKQTQFSSGTNGTLDKMRTNF